LTWSLCCRDLHFGPLTLTTYTSPSSSFASSSHTGASCLQSVVVEKGTGEARSDGDLGSGVGEFQVLAAGSRGVGEGGKRRTHVHTSPRRRPPASVLSLPACAKGEGARGAVSDRTGGRAGQIPRREPVIPGRGATMTTPRGAHLRVEVGLGDLDHLPGWIGRCRGDDDPHEHHQRAQHRSNHPPLPRPCRV